MTLAHDYKIIDWHVKSISTKLTETFNYTPHLIEKDILQNPFDESVSRQEISLYYSTI